MCSCFYSLSLIFRKPNSRGFSHPRHWRPTWRALRNREHEILKFVFHCSKCPNKASLKVVHNHSCSSNMYRESWESTSMLRCCSMPRRWNYTLLHFAVCKESVKRKQHRFADLCGCIVHSWCVYRLSLLICLAMTCQSFLLTFSWVPDVFSHLINLTVAENVFYRKIR